MSVRGCFLAACVAIAFVVALPALGQDEGDPRPTGGERLEARLVQAFETKDFATALDLIDQQAVVRPKDPFVEYNRACALAMLGRSDEAGESLVRALSLGFVDLFQIERDEHLEPLRGHLTYRTITKGWRELLDARGEADLAAAREALGPKYTYESDTRLRFNFASAFAPTSFEAAKREIERVTAWAQATVLGAAPVDEHRPDPWVLIILPTPNDFAGLVGGAGIGGYYDRDRKRLVTQDIGPSLRHEFFHVLHWRQMDRLGQQHALWVMEGLASLLEDVEADGPDGLRIVPSWRTNIVKRLDRAGRLTPWPALFTLGRDAFMGARARANYAQSRAVFMFLLDEGLLADWYDAYVSAFDADPTGLAATERVLAVPSKKGEAKFREWVRRLPEVGEQSRPPRASLGVEVGPGDGDGPEVRGAALRSRARYTGEDRLRLRDVITAIDGRSTRTLDDLFRVLSELQVGRRVTLDVRRGGRMVRVGLELVDRDAPDAGNTP